MDVTIRGPAPVTGALLVPADKAICHRVALLCALAEGATDVSPWASAQDCRYTRRLVEHLGVEVVDSTEGIRINGVGLEGLRAPAVPLECGESGTTIRLACGLLAGQPFASRLVTAPSLARRPMRRIIEPLTKMGARVEGASSSDGDVRPPLIVHGRRPLRGLTYTMPVASAQVKSAILIAGLSADGPVRVVEPVRTRDHTERLLGKLGVAVQVAGEEIRLEPPRSGLRAPGRLVVPGDFSSAAFFLVAAAILPGSRLRIADVGLNPTRRSLLSILERMGARIECRMEDDGWEPRGSLLVEARSLRGTTIQAHEAALMIDELPILMVAACAAEGRTRFEGLQELRVKETDRIRSMTAGLRAMGAKLEPEGTSDLVIAQSRLRGSVVESFGDHRTAMSLAIAGLLADGQTRIRGSECVQKSFGEFFRLLASVAPQGVVQQLDSQGER